LELVREVVDLEEVVCEGCERMKRSGAGVKD
jgi:hypothetical protein